MNSPKRKLVLNKETIRRLDANELGRVAGGGSQDAGTCVPDTPNSCDSCPKCMIDRDITIVINPAPVFTPIQIGPISPLRGR
jgi:hypothetical protein